MTQLQSTSGASLADVIRSTARAAGALLRERYHDQGEVRSKGRGNVVTDVDAAAERLIADRLLEEFPAFSFLGEETGERPGDAEWQWIADPIDGTRNYVSRLPLFCVMVSLAHRGRTVAGATYDPLRDEMFYAEAGQGAALNGRAIRVGEQRVVSDCVVGLDLGYDDELARRALGVAGEVFPGLQAIRVQGSVGLGLAGVASGRLDLYFCAGGNPWDIASGSLLVSEAGGVITDRRGDPVMLPSDGIIAANPAAHADFLRLTERLPFRAAP